MRRCIFLIAILVGLGAEAQALDTIYLIRHAEKETAWPRVRELHSMQPLSAEGLERSERWADYFAEREAGGGIAVVYGSPTTRTLHTGLPIAQRAGAELLASPATITPDDMPAFLEGLRGEFADASAVVIVGHSNTVPLLLRALGATEECDEALGISEQSYGPGIEGNAGVWIVDLAGEGCAAFAREEVE
jgi:broad specificity phosphatase PhoE